jgi:hypothetical protein
MYSSATTSSSASGFIGGGLALFVGEDFGEDFGEGEGDEVGAAEEAGEGDGDDFALGERAGFSEGVGEVFCNGFTGPVGRRGGGGLAPGVGEGDGAAARMAAPKQTSSAKMNGRDLIESRGAPTLDDALRVAKNFRMSDHRPHFETPFFL